MDAVALLQSNIVTLEKRIEKLRAQLATAETERDEATTAVRVLSRLGLAPTVEGADTPRTSSKLLVLNAVPTRETDAMTPAEIHALLDAAGHKITADNVRTILSRNREAFASNLGRYWRLSLKSQGAKVDESPDSREIIPMTPEQAFGNPREEYRSAFAISDDEDYLDPKE